MALTELIQSFLFHCEFERRLANNTVRSYASDLAQLQLFTIGKETDSILTVATLRDYLVDMQLERNLSNATARRRLACLRAFCHYVTVNHGFNNPFEDWSPSIQRPKTLPRALARTDLSRILLSLHSKSEIDADTGFCALLLLATGLRVSELCAIRVPDVASDGSAVHIHGKGSRDRVVYISSSSMRQELIRLRQERMKASLSAIFLNTRNQPLTPQALRRRLHGLVKRFAVGRSVTPHMLRHTAATLLIEAGTDIRFVQRLLGHASIATTEIYTHVTDPALKEAILHADIAGNLV